MVAFCIKRNLSAGGCFFVHTETYHVVCRIVGHHFAHLTTLVLSMSASRDSWGNSRLRLLERNHLEGLRITHWHWMLVRHGVSLVSLINGVEIISFFNYIGCFQRYIVAIWNSMTVDSWSHLLAGCQHYIRRSLCSVLLCCVVASTIWKQFTMAIIILLTNDLL